MKVVKSSNFVGEERLDVGKHIIDVNRDLANIILALTGRVRFGRGTDGDRGENIHGEFQQIVTNATPDTEDATAHTLGSVPVGFLVLHTNKAGVIYKGTTTWTATNIYLRSNVASVTALLFLLK